MLVVVMFALQPLKRREGPPRFSWVRGANIFQLGPRRGRVKSEIPTAAEGHYLKGGLKSMYSVIDRQSLDRKVFTMAPGHGMFLLDCRVHKKSHAISNASTNFLL